MSLDWGRSEEGDSTRARRLAGSYAAALLLVATLLGVGIVFGGQIKKQVFEDEVDVKFVPPEPVAVKAPPPPPPPPPPPRMAAATPAALGQKRDAPPTELPKAPPAEGDPNEAKPEGPAGDGDPNGVLGGRGHAGAAGKPTEAPPAPSIALPVLQIAEVPTPPVPLSRTMPAYPEEARKQGIEAVVVVKFVIGDSGKLEDVKVVKGHPLFDAVVLSAVRDWTFEPATLAGKAVRMARMVKIPFRLKHS